MLKEPIKLTLYDDNEEEIRTEECKIIPWGMLKRALIISTGKNGFEKDIDNMGDFVLDLFKGRVTKKELEENVPIDQVRAAFRYVIAEGNKNIPNA